MEMPVRRSLLASLVLVILGALAAPALATQGPPIPVGVGKDSKGGVCVYAFSWVPQCVDPGPISAGAPRANPVPPVYVSRKSNGAVCVAWGTTMPVCTPGLPPVASSTPRQTLPVTVVNNSRVVGVLVKDTSGAPLAAAVIYKDGSGACAGLSYQAPICV